LEDFKSIYSRFDKIWQPIAEGSHNQATE